MTDQPRILYDRGTKRPILMSPGRLHRPRNTGETDDGETGCPFCEGHETRTTEEVDAIRQPGSQANTPGWTARAFPNLYPAAAFHEVIAEGCRHTAHPTELNAEELRDCLQLYRRRIAAAEAQPGIECAFLFKNVGAKADSSIEHNHSQLLGLPVLPPRLVSERQANLDGGNCLHCEEIESAEREGRVIVQTNQHILLSPSTPKLPYEAWLLPIAHGDDFHTDTQDEDLVQAFALSYQAIAQGFARGPFNSFLHRIPGADFHWHIEFQPREGQVAALELGGDMYINAVTPPESVQRWQHRP